MKANTTKLGVAVRNALAALAVTACVGSAIANVSVGVGVGVGAGGGVSVGGSVNLDFGTCHRELSPYGTWTATAEYGDVWLPAGMPADWHPYSYGQWVYTDAGWYWQSNYTWGWLPFHYGRWQRHPAYGWCWAPGYVWAPAWVTWHYTDAYVGWSPIPACGVGVSFNVAPCDWFFVGFGSFMVGNPWCYSVPYTYVGPAVCRPYAVVNNYYFIDNYYHCGTRRCHWYGPAPRVIEQHVNRRLQPLAITSTDVRTRNGRVGERSIEIYRPGASQQLVQREVPERILARVERSKTAEAGRSIGAPRIGSSLTDAGRVERGKGGTAERSIGERSIGTAGQVERPQTTRKEGISASEFRNGRSVETPTPATGGIRQGGESPVVRPQPSETPAGTEKSRTSNPTRTFGEPRIGASSRVVRPQPVTQPGASTPVVRPQPVTQPGASTPVVRPQPVETPAPAVTPRTPQPTAPVRSIGQPRISVPQPVPAQPVTPSVAPATPMTRPTMPMPSVRPAVPVTSMPAPSVRPTAPVTMPQVAPGSAVAPMQGMSGGMVSEGRTR